MKEFLAYVADDILAKHGTNLSRMAIVFPNKRASLFLNEYLARRAGQPLWSPAYTTISDLFRQLSPLVVADPIKLVCDLHRSFCQQTASTETLDKFYGWGQLLLSDFDDIDKNMADADRVFANLRDIHELDDVSYLTDAQKAMLQRFFSTFSADHNSELKERFLRLWSHFADIYHDYNRRLADQGLCYEGALYRQVATIEQPDLPYDTYVFVGFNLLQKVEQRLFQTLQGQGKARFYWDFDHYYLRQHHEAGQYIGQYLRHFPNELDSNDDAIYGNFQKSKHIRFIATPTETIQAHYVSDWLMAADQADNNTADKADEAAMPRCQAGRRTAIVMCNEGLLQTIIHCLPPAIDKVNITTGYPLSQTSVASLVQQLVTLQLSQYPPRPLRVVRRHPYSRFIADELLTHRLPQLTNGDLLAWLLTILRQVADQGRQHVSDPLFQESVFRTYQLVNRLQALVSCGDLIVDVVTMQRLIDQLIQQTTIPFHGEPAEGIQVMGVLETRNLDFDHLLLLSCNEGNMPRGVNDSSFIPHSIRRAYELTTVDNKVAIYAYYFHRLLQRARDITIVYNNSTEDGQRGEQSRFMLQLLVESGHHVSHQTLRSGQSTVSLQPAAIVKTPRVVNILHMLFASADSLLSPSAINRYLRCPLQFYYRYVANLREPDVPDDEQELDNRIFGNIFHEAADIVYHQLPRRITRDVLQAVLRDPSVVQRAVDEAFHHQLPHAHGGGLQLINREVIIRYLQQLVRLDIQLAPFTILGLEHDVWRPVSLDGLPTLRFGGRIDRLDLTGEGTSQECIRVVDYKTGGHRLKGLASVDDIFDPTHIHDHSDYYLQTFAYADIVRRQTSRRVVPALLFIQHAGVADYDPTLTLGKSPVGDIADHSARFSELLHQKIQEIFDAAVPFQPTADPRVCQSCPYAPLCR